MKFAPYTIGIKRPWYNVAKSLAKYVSDNNGTWKMAQQITIINFINLRIMYLQILMDDFQDSWLIKGIFYNKARW